MDGVYIAIDLKSFYASVECVQRGLDPLDANLVVADLSRTEKTICLAVSPSLKKYGISGRARLFEVIESVKQLNTGRLSRAPRHSFSGESFLDSELMKSPGLKLTYITAPPQMSLYMKVSTQIYGIYLKYVAPEDIFAYSIDEVFINAAGYLRTYNTTPRGFARMLIRDVLETTGITATAGIGTNMYLCKIAMDIVAKHIPADKDGVRIAELDETSYKEKLWEHKPITDFWRVGGGIAARLAKLGMYTMGDVARASLSRWQTEQLYKAFGKNTELLIDHAWGIEPTTIADVKSYRPENCSISSGQVLKGPTDSEQTRLILWEMADQLALDLVEKRLVTKQIVVTIGYDRASLADGHYTGEVTADHYGRPIPKHAHGTFNLKKYTSSAKKLEEAAMELYDRIADSTLLSRRLNITAAGVISEDSIPPEDSCDQLDFFTLDTTGESYRQEEQELAKEHALQQAMLKIKRRYGKNAVLKGKNFIEGGTAIERNGQIGGHKA